MPSHETLYQLRRKNGLSQEALARKPGVSRQAISRWELGEVVPDTANVLKLCEVFHITADAPLRDSDSSRKPEQPKLQEHPEDNEAGALRRNIRAANPGIPVRVLLPGAWLALHLWLATEDPGWRFSFLLLGSTSFRWYFREQGSSAMLRWDLLLSLLLPRVLSSVPDRWGIPLGPVPGLLIPALPIRSFLQDHCRVEPPGQRRTSEEHHQGTA